MQGQVRRLPDPLHDERPMGLQHRLAVPSYLARGNRAARTIALRPLHHRRNPNPKPRGHRSAAMLAITAATTRTRRSLESGRVIDAGLLSSQHLESKPTKDPPPILSSLETRSRSASAASTFSFAAQLSSPAMIPGVKREALRQTLYRRRCEASSPGSRTLGFARRRRASAGRRSATQLAPTQIVLDTAEGSRFHHLDIDIRAPDRRLLRTAIAGKALGHRFHASAPGRNPYGHGRRRRWEAGCRPQRWPPGHPVGWPVLSSAHFARIALALALQAARSCRWW